MVPFKYYCYFSIGWTALLKKKYYLRVSLLTVAIGSSSRIPKLNSSLDGSIVIFNCHVFENLYSLQISVSFSDKALTVLFLIFLFIPPPQPPPMKQCEASNLELRAVSKGKRKAGRLSLAPSFRASPIFHWKWAEIINLLAEITLLGFLLRLPVWSFGKGNFKMPDLILKTSSWAVIEQVWRT